MKVQRGCGGGWSGRGRSGGGRRKGLGGEGGCAGAMGAAGSSDEANDIVYYIIIEVFINISTYSIVFLKYSGTSLKYCLVYLCMPS